MKLLPALLFVLLPVGVIHTQSPSDAIVPVLDQYPSFGARAEEYRGRNLLTNANFERGTANWELLNWGKNGKMEMDSDELHNGRPTLRVENFESCHSFVRQIVAGKPYTRYRFTGYIKTKDVEAEVNGQKTGAILMIGRMYIYSALIAGTTPWTAVSAEFATKEDGEIRLGPSLGTDAIFPTGTAWFSGLRLVELGPVEGNIPIPERAKTFLDPVETLLKSAPASAVQKLRDFSAMPEAMQELNRYFATYAINKSIVLHTTIEAADPLPDSRNSFRIRAASTPLELDGGTMKRLSWLYFQPADAAEANSVKVGSEITVVGWIRRCEVVMMSEGLRLNFDLQYSRIISASMRLPEPNVTNLRGGVTPSSAPAHGEDINQGYTRAGYPVIDLRQDLAGTSWKTAPGQPVRPGLVSLLTFNGKTVEPADYRYEANAHDSTVTIFFNHGDTQVMLLTDERKRLRFTFGGRDYTYDLVSN